MPDLVAEMPEQRAVWLVHRHPQLFAVYVVALGEIQRDHTVVVARVHLLVLAGEQVECQAVLRVLVATHDRQLQLMELDDQPPFGLLRIGVRRQRLGIGVIGPCPGQRARFAQPPGRCHLHQPIAFSQMKVGAELVLARVDRAGVLRVLAGFDDQQRHVVEGEADPTTARQADRILEGQVLAAVRADEITHAALRPRTAPRRRRRRSRCSRSRCR